eukprot:TRINITY_DN124133_c0_g1_i1.p1 TRINITY_DN124133_c0_g1~~TRINITY_DN124133_c0_g1_i1.p1  ORF type:complete len:151 (-),score=28.12 TRINITY_DN124133_c0_g1_i1:60-512(-)
MVYQSIEIFYSKNTGSCYIQVPVGFSKSMIGVIEAAFKSCIVISKKYKASAKYPWENKGDRIMRKIGKQQLHNAGIFVHLLNKLEAVGWELVGPFTHSYLGQDYLNHMGAIIRYNPNLVKSSSSSNNNSEETPSNESSNNDNNEENNEDK